MKNIAIINGLNLTVYAEKPFAGGINSLERVLNDAENLPETKDIVLLGRETLSSRPNIRVVSDKITTGGELLSAIIKISEGYDNIFYFYGDCPFLDSGITRKMYKDHTKYFAEYTFADGYPYGITPEIIKTDILPNLVKLLGENKEEAWKSFFFDIIKKDINAFDIETVIAPQDLRLLRVSLSADTKRNFMLVQRVAEKRASDADAISKILQENGDLLRTLPAYIAIQIVEGCPQLCSYCPYSLNLDGAAGKRGEMSIETLSAIIHKVKDFSGDAVIDLSLWGEPAFHSGIDEVISLISKIPGFRVVIETSGIGWKEGIFEKIKLETEKSPTWIVSLDAVEESTYQIIRGSGFKEALKNTEKLFELFKGNVYVQAVRMKENEEELEKFYRNWKKITDNIIIQKYDNFCGVLPDRKVTDLSPLKRFPCWHLKRDLYVRTDGSVPLCREDISGKHILGNIINEPVKDIWERGGEYYRQHLSANYPEMCLKCDEYYTYNF